MDVINWDAAKFWLDVGQWVVTIAIGIAVWIRTGRNQNRNAIDALDQQQDALERRVLTVENHLKHAPTHEDITKVREEIAGMQSALNTNTSMVQRVHDYLLNKKD